MDGRLQLVLYSATEFVIPLNNVPPGTTIVSATLMIKTTLDDLDANALLTKSITPAQSAQGYVLNITTGSGAGPTATTGTAELHFDFTETDAVTAGLVTTAHYVWAAKMKLSSGYNIRPFKARGAVEILSSGIQLVQ